MKKLFLLTIALIGAASTFAQTITYGIKAGVNFSQISASVQNITASSNNLTGFHVGGVIDFGVSKSFSIQPGILYTTKGGSSTDVTSDGTGSGANASKITLNYLEIPVNFLYHAPAGKGSVFIGGGPYVGIGLSGSAPLVDQNGQSTGQKQSIHFGSTVDDIANPDYGINLLGGYKFENNLTLSVGYGIGLANLSNEDIGKIHNRSLNFSIGFFFK